jgi:opacity protein-like surface antigen
MRAITWGFVIFVGLSGVAEARQSWDAGATIGSFGASPQTPPATYNDEWYFNARYAVAIGKYWTDHIKTELEFSGSGEGSRYVQRFVDVPGVPPHYPIGAQEYSRLQQASARVVYQFYDNAWVHPYVFGGVGLDMDRRRTRVAEQYFYPSSGAFNPANRILVTRAIETGPKTEFRPAGILGAGAKMYMTPKTYFNAAAITSFGQATRTISFVAGFGLDF